ncbi:beta-galactosidase [Paenibacillus sp. 598K]|uniref:beta-galactosidase n=1 Tax=Paenibacillus sp. 598K TaxID=1117987 RepID=UPI001623C7FA|nr:beta-galactosidase [Paenibacillus sp. 598K]
MAVGTSGCAQQAEPTEEQGVFPVGMWVSPPVEELTNERYEEIAGAGINVVIGFQEWTGGEEAQRKSLDLAAAAGMRVLVRDPELLAIDPADEEALAERVLRYQDHEAYMGHVFYDEPAMEQYAQLSTLAGTYRTLVPEGLAYVNLLPTYSTLHQRGGTYDEYVQGFIEQFRPEVLSYDHYPFLIQREGAGSEITEDYFYNLDYMSRQSVQHKLPFWTFIQTLAFNDSHRDPTEAEIRWQVFTSLAYGAKGVQYFTYWTPDNGREWFGDAMIDRQGERTAHYDQVKRVNEALQTMGPHLLGLTLQGMHYHGFEPPLVDGEGTIAEAIIEVAGDPALVGSFVDRRGTSSALVVGRSYEAPTALELTLDASVDEVLVIQGTTSETRRPNGDRKLRLELAPGEGAWLQFRT